MFLFSLFVSFFFSMTRRHRMKGNASEREDERSGDMTGDERRRVDMKRNETQLNQRGRFSRECSCTSRAVHKTPNCIFAWCYLLAVLQIKGRYSYFGKDMFWNPPPKSFHASSEQHASCIMIASHMHCNKHNSNLHLP